MSGRMHGLKRRDPDDLVLDLQNVSLSPSKKLRVYVSSRLPDHFPVRDSACHEISRRFSFPLCQGLKKFSLCI